MHAGIIANLLFILGVCLATIGAAGFHNPTKTGRPGAAEAATEKAAWPLFVAGVTSILAGSGVLRLARKGRAAQAGANARLATEKIRTFLGEIQRIVRELDEAKGSCTREELCRRIDALLSGPYFDLVDVREDFLAQVGFAPYAQVWDGVATAERQLARVWSLTTDGHMEEGLADLPLARHNLDRACQALEGLGK